MMRKKHNHFHMFDLFFTFSLFAVFAASAFIAVMIGVQVYRTTVSQMENIYSTTTALSYVTQKIRQYDSQGSISITDIDGDPALLIKDTIHEDTYLTYIYSDEESLYELSVREGNHISKDMGSEIVAVKDFSIADKGEGFLELSASERSGTTVNILIHMRSELPDTAGTEGGAGP